MSKYISRAVLPLPLDASSVARWPKLVCIYRYIIQSILEPWQNQIIYHRKASLDGGCGCTIIKQTIDVQCYEACTYLFQDELPIVRRPLTSDCTQCQCAINNNDKQQKLKEASQGVESNQGRLGLGTSLSISFYILKVHDWRCGCYPRYRSRYQSWRDRHNTSCALPGEQQGFFSQLQALQMYAQYKEFESSFCDLAIVLLCQSGIVSLASGWWTAYSGSSGGSIILVWLLL